MPRTVAINTSNGPAEISYMICTPNSENAESIDPRLPTVVLLHSIYTSQVIFHYQFSSPDIRRFNLVAFDMRCHGDTVARVPLTFRQADAAEDVYYAMKALNLPRCHFFGVSLGSCIAQEVAISYPDQVLSLFLVSPVPPDEPELSAFVRQQIYDCWADDFKDPENVNVNSGEDAVRGALELGFSSNSSNILKMFATFATKRGRHTWRSERLEDFHTMTVKFWRERPAHPISSLQKIACPVHLVYCAEDLVYPLDLVETLRDRMKEAGVEVRLSQIPDAPHCSVASHPEPVNELFLEWMLSLVSDAVISPAKASASSPYEEELILYGLNDPTEEDSDSEDMFVI